MRMRTRKLEVGAVLNLVGATAVLVAAWIACADQALQALAVTQLPVLRHLLG